MKTTTKVEAKESLVGVISSWAALGASFLLSFATWVELAKLAGFDQEWNVMAPGYTITISLAWAMGVAVDGYVITALVAWMSPVSEEVARFAKVNTYVGALVSVLAQSAFHGFTVYSITPADTRGWMTGLAATVGALPPMAGALSVHMRALVRRSAMAKAATAEVADAPRPQGVDNDVDNVPAVNGRTVTAFPVPSVPVRPARPRTNVPARPQPVQVPVPPADIPAVPVPSPALPVGVPSVPVNVPTIAVPPVRIEVPTITVPPVRVNVPRDLGTGLPLPSPSPAPVSRPRASVTTSSWGDMVAELLDQGQTVAQIHAALPGQWKTVEGAKKAIQRFKKSGQLNIQEA